MIVLEDQIQIFWYLHIILIYILDIIYDFVYFQALVDCKKDVCEKLKLNPSEIELSMGMSDDFEHAVSIQFNIYINEYNIHSQFLMLLIYCYFCANVIMFKQLYMQ